MNIKEAKYYNFQGAVSGIKLTLTDDTEVIVPRKVGNRHYDAILEWLASPEHYIVLDRTASNGANAGNKVLLEDGNDLRLETQIIEPAD